MDFGDIQVRYHSHNIVNGLSALPVPQNPMLEKRILTLSPIGKKLAGPYHVLHHVLRTGGEAHDIVQLTFFLWEINQKNVVATIGFSGTARTLITFSKVSARYFR